MEPLVAVGADETEESILARTQRFEMKKRELEGYVEEYTEEWYRLKYPGFPDEFYPLFAKASGVAPSGSDESSGEASDESMENNVDQQ